MKIKIGIVGYENRGLRIEKEIKKYDDMELVAIFTKEDSKKIMDNNNIYGFQDINKFENKIDVMILCITSYKDLIKYAYNIAKKFNTVDNYDINCKTYSYCKHINKINRRFNTVSIVSAGWDLRILSMFRLIFESTFPTNQTYAFLNREVNLSHLEAIENIEGVKKVSEQTILKEDIIESIKNNSDFKFKNKDMYIRECFVVIKNDNKQNRKIIENKIKSISKNFNEYDTIVNFISEEVFNEKYIKFPKEEFTVFSNQMDDNKSQDLELSMKLKGNPGFSANLLLVYARAAFKLANKDRYGSYTIYDIPISYITDKKTQDIIEKML